jgi:UDP-N-acetyl-D-galactosamine dehydrogenase
MDTINTKIAVVGLGYVGLPLAVALSKYFQVTGFDISENRVRELKEGYDRTNEISTEKLKQSTLVITSDANAMLEHNIYIVTVPTPVDDDNKPDLDPLRNASKALGSIIGRGATIVYESTVYPGVTEDICGPILESVSGLKAGEDFFLGYSPERINPGDTVHTVEKITKVVAGQTAEIAQKLAQIYGKVNNNNIFIAKSIRAAEAAKVIENTQRDINIAFMNEITMIFAKMNLSIHDVLDAASTKWNFLKFTPGLVGGHCIGVDPYYLAEAAKALGHKPEIILAGRKTNESMAYEFADLINQRIGKPARLLVLGLTFKEDVPDLRNTKVTDLISSLKKRGHKVDVHDACADPLEAKKYFDIDLLPVLTLEEKYDGVVGTVPHKSYLEFQPADFQRFLKPQGFVCDLKGMWRNNPPSGFNYWSL